MVSNMVAELEDLRDGVAQELNVNAARIGQLKTDLGVFEENMSLRQWTPELGTVGLSMELGNEVLAAKSWKTEMDMLENTNERLRTRGLQLEKTIGEATAAAAAVAAEAKAAQEPLPREGVATAAVAAPVADTTLTMMGNQVADLAVQMKQVMNMLADKGKAFGPSILGTEAARAVDYNGSRGEWEDEDPLQGEGDPWPKGGKGHAKGEEYGPGKGKGYDKGKGFEWGWDGPFGGKEFERLEEFGSDGDRWGTWLENFLVQVGKYPNVRAAVEVAARVRSEVETWEEFVKEMDLGWSQFMKGQLELKNPLVEVGTAWRAVNDKFGGALFRFLV